MKLRRVYQLASRVLLCLSASTLTACAHARDAREMGLLPEPTGPLLGFEKPGDVPSLPANGELVVQKVLVEEARLVRALVLNPADGRMDSWNYAQFVSEYDDAGYVSKHWELSTYEYSKNPGMHMTLKPGGFNYLYLRGGFEGEIYRDVDALDGPGNGRLLKRVSTSDGPEGRPHYRIARVAFDETVDAKKITFFRRKNLLGDAAFYRIGSAAQPENYRGSIDFKIGARVQDVSTLGPDFNRLPTSKPEEQHLSTFERRFFRSENRTVYALENQGTASVPMAAQQIVHFLTPEIPKGTAVGAVRLNLKLAEAQPGKLLHVAVHDPLDGARELVRIDVRLNQSKEVNLLLDFPDQIMPQGRRFWITLASQEPITLEPASTLSLLTTPKEKALTEYVDHRLYFVKGLFSLISSARPWTNVAMSAEMLRNYDGKDWNIQKRRLLLLELFNSIEHLHELAPEHPLVQQYYDWLTRFGKPAIDPKDIPEIAIPPGVPRWAALMNRAIKSTLDVPRWWIENRQVPHGEFGSFLSDDTDFVQWWPALVFMGSDSFAQQVRESYLKLAPLLQEMNLKDGVSRRVTDALHSYEEGTNHFSVMPLLFYGDPRYVEELMTAARTTEKWMYQTPQGLNFRENKFGWATAQNPLEPTGKVSPGAAMMLHPHLMLGWYNHNPHATKILASYADHFGGYMEGGFGAAPNVSFAAYWLTGNEKYLGFPKPDADGKYTTYRDWAEKQGLFAAKVPQARQQPWWEEYRKFVSPQWNRGEWAWAVDQNKKTLEKALEFSLWGNPAGLSGGIEKYFYIWTAAEQVTDRVFLPVDIIAQPMLGGYSTRNRLWPAYTVSYEKLDGDFAALVLDQGRDKLKVTMINLADRQRDGLFRVWTLDPGQYELKIGPDANDDGVIDSVESTRTLDLKRMSPVEVALPSRKLMIYELRQLKAHTPLHERSDVAISPDDVKRQGNNVSITVHNIGAVAAENFTVSLQDRNGKVLATKIIPRLDAPLDLKPKTVTLSLPFIAGATRVVLDLQSTLEEITEVNNTVAFPEL